MFQIKTDVISIINAVMQTAQLQWIITEFMCLCSVCQAGHSFQCFWRCWLIVCKHIQTVKTSVQQSQRFPGRCV